MTQSGHSQIHHSVVKLVHEHWIDESDGEHMFCLAGPTGDEARSLLVGDAKLVWTCEAESHFEAMTKYYKHQGWGEYTSDFEELDRRPYLDELGIRWTMVRYGPFIGMMMALGTTI